jgi:hypothetical protein
VLVLVFVAGCVTDNDVIARGKPPPDAAGDEKPPTPGDPMPSPPPPCAELSKGIVLANKLGDLFVFFPQDKAVKPVGHPKCFEPPHVPTAMAIDRGGTIFVADENHLVHVISGPECKPAPLKLVSDAPPVGLAFVGDDLYGFDKEGLVRFEAGSFNRVAIGPVKIVPSALVPTADGRLYGRYDPGDQSVGLALIGVKDAMVVSVSSVDLGPVASVAPVAAWGPELFVFADQIYRFKLGGPPDKVGVSLEGIHPLLATSSPCAGP